MLPIIEAWDLGLGTWDLGLGALLIDDCRMVIEEWTNGLALSLPKGWTVPGISNQRTTDNGL